MNLKHLETFVAISETGSFQAAAERLFVTQSAVSMQMKTLEDQLQVALFDRSTRPPTLSTLGRVLLERARALVVQAQEFREAAQGEGDLAGALAIGVIPSATTTILPPALQVLGQRHPLLQVRVAGGLSRGLEDLVVQGVIDCAIVTETDRVATNLTQLTIFKERLLVAAPVSAPPNEPENWLLDHPFIRFNRQTGTGRIIERELRSQGLPVREAMELDSIEAILLMVSRGLGVAVVPERSLTDDLSNHIQTQPFGDPCVERRVGVLMRRNARQRPLVEALHDALITASENDRGTEQKDGPNEDQ